MNKKTIILITAILSFSLGQSLKLPSIASTDLQSTGRIIVTNPDTGNEEIIFDATDQVKLKNSITANASEILDLKEWQEQQLEINQELSDKAFDLETDIDELTDSLGGFTPVIDEGTGKITGYKTKVGADTVFPFKKGIDKVVFRVTIGASMYENHTRMYYKADFYRDGVKIDSIDICNNHVMNGLSQAQTIKTWTLSE